MGILRVQGASESAGGLLAHDDVDIEVEEGTVHAVIGPDGAGGSTLLDTPISRFPPDAGTVTFDGVPVIGMRQYEINKASVIQVLRTPGIFARPDAVRERDDPGLAVEENL